jgi:pimeloyl-ACP methyl ester carboxylesterase
MFPSIGAVGRSIRGAAVLSPRLAAHLEMAAFFRTRPRMRLREIDAPTDLAARREVLQAHGREIVGYRWGEGPRTVLLLHGWQGRATQFAPLIRELVAAGFRVVSFDAPAHGASAGRHTDIRDWLEATGRLQSRYGEFHAIIGHSLGALAALTAARTIAPTTRVAAIAGAASPAAFIADFSTRLGVDAATRSAAESLFRSRFGESEASFRRRFDAAADTLPSATELLVVHDRQDPRMPDTDSLRLHDAHAGRSRMLRTAGLGHNRILAADPVLDALVAFTTGGLSAVDALEGEFHFPSVRA